MQTPLASTRRLDGRRHLARVGRRLLVAYWIACLAVIVLGLDRIYPDARAAALAVLRSPAEISAAPTLELFAFPGDALPAPAPRFAHPFRNCAAAHAAGVYDIPFGSPAYTPRQDRDGDGLACEPY